MRAEKGFTLIELLTIIGLIGILYQLGLTAFYEYRGKAAYSVAEKTLRDARTAIEAGLNDYDNPPGAVPLTVQDTQGPMSDPSLQHLLPGMMLPGSVTFRVFYDPSCQDAGCQSEMMQTNHCKGEEFVRWVRFGDGLSVWMEHLAGAGC